MDVKTYQLAVAQSNKKDKDKYTSLEGRVENLEENVSKSETTFFESFDDTRYLDNTKTTAKIEKGTIKMPPYLNGNKVLPFDSYYDIDLESSNGIEVSEERVILTSSATKGKLVTKWINIPKSNNLDVSAIVSKGTKVQTEPWQKYQNDLCYLYKDDYEDDLYLIKINHRPLDAESYWRIRCEKYDKDLGSAIRATESKFYKGSEGLNDGYFWPIAGCSITRSYNGDLNIGYIINDSKSIFGYGVRGSSTIPNYDNRHAQYTSDNCNVAIKLDYANYYSKPKNVLNTDDSFYCKNLLDRGNRLNYIISTINIEGNISSTYTRDNADVVRVFESWSSINYDSNAIGYALYSINPPVSFKTIRNDSETVMNVFPKSRHSLKNLITSYGNNYSKNSFGDMHSHKTWYNGTNTILFPTSDFEYDNCTDLKLSTYNYGFHHDGVAYATKIQEQKNIVDYSTVLKIGERVEQFAKSFEIAYPFDTLNKKINKMQYLRRQSHLLVITSNDVNSLCFEKHYIDKENRTIRETCHPDNTKKIINFSSQFGIVFNTQFTSYGHTGSYYSVHEDSEKDVIHFLFPGRRVGENTYNSRLYYMTLNSKTLEVIVAPTQVFYNYTSQSDLYDYQNVSVCSIGDTVLFSFLISDGLDHTDTYIYKSSTIGISNVKMKIETDDGSIIDVTNFKGQKINYKNPVSRFRIIAELDNSINPDVPSQTFIDHVEVGYDGSVGSSEQVYVMETKEIELSHDNGRVSLYPEQDEKDGRIEWFFSFDGGVKWEPYMLGQHFKYDSQKKTIKIKAELGSNTSNITDMFRTPFIRNYSLKIDGGVLHTDLVNIQINLMKTNFKIDSFTNASKNGLSRMTIDVFNDESNIHKPNSDYTYDSQNKLVYGKRVVSKSEEISWSTTKVLITSEEINSTPKDYINYFVSRDNGNTFFKVTPNVLTTIPRTGANGEIYNKLVVKAEFVGDAKLSAWAWSWD